MKNLRNSICVLSLLVFGGNFVGYTQDAPKSLQEAKAKKDKEVRAKQEAAKQDGEAKLSDEAAKQKQNADQIKKEAGNQASDIKNEAQQDPKKVEAELKKIEEKMSKATTEDQKKELQAYYDDVKSGKKSVSNNSKDEIKDAKNELKKDVKEAKDAVEDNSSAKYSDLRGKELGKARSAKTLKKIEANEAGMTDRIAYVKSSRKRIGMAKESLQRQIDAGSLTQEEIAAKKARIEKAEISLKAYETRVDDGKKKYSDYKKNVSGMYQDN